MNASNPTGSNLTSKLPITFIPAADCFTIYCSKQ